MEGAIDDQKGVIRSYRDLRVWQEAMDLAEACYRTTRAFPKEELYGITAQMRRAAASVAANIAEGHGRDGRGEFVRFLRVAQGSLKELETRLLLSQRVELASAKTVDGILGRCEATGKMLRALIRSLQRKGVRKDASSE
jgi:four helix bundle protein